MYIQPTYEGLILGIKEEATNNGFSSFREIHKLYYEKSFERRNFMEHNCGSFYMDHTISRRCDSIDITGLALIGVASIVWGIATWAYRVGRETKEFEMTREFKRYLKKQRKEGK